MIKREQYMKRIRPFIGNDLIKVLTGVRRAGKSVMLELIKNELMESGVGRDCFISLNFESMTNAGFCTAEALYKELERRIGGKSGKFYLFLDEIQEVANWEKCVNSLRVDFDCDLYITGSNAKLLSGELATYLGGRYVEFMIYPFSFAEFLESRKTEGVQPDLREEFRNYLLFGGMPFLSRLRDKDAGMQYLADIYNSVMLKDVVSRNNIRDAELLNRIVTYVVANIGHTLSATSISRYFKSENRTVPPGTVLNYIKACTDACLFVRVDRADLPGKKILAVSEKYYMADHGMREAIYGGNTRDIDQVLENIVAMELVRRGYRVSVGKNGDREIDFVAEKRGEKLYVQVAYLLSSEDVVKREFGAYRGIEDNYPKYVVSMDEQDMSQNGIRHLGITDFLLKENWN